MLFTIKNNKYQSAEYLRTNTLLRAYCIIQKYPMHAQEIALDNYLQLQYKTSLKNMCIKLLLSLTFHEDDSGDFILLFKHKEHDQMATLITYGNGAIPGSQILKVALANY
jgi:hypothetical protein